MIKSALKDLIRKNKTLILNEAQQVNGFMALLMKHRNTGTLWTKREKRQLTAHMKRLSLYVPVLIIFLLPLGSLLIPVLAEVLDRRNAIRTRQNKTDTEIESVTPH